MWSHDDPFSRRNPYIAALLVRDVYRRHAWLGTTRGSAKPAARSPPDNFCEAMARLGADECEVVDGASGLVYALLVAGPSVILAFPGSRSPADWILDLDTLKATTVYDLGGSSSSGPQGAAAGVSVDAGFYQAFSANKEAIAERVKRARAAAATSSGDGGGGEGVSRLWVAGHGLGGAVALMVAAYLEAQEGLSATAVYTYGSPKVGDATWVQAYGPRDATLRFELPDDPVPAMPRWPVSWRHAGTPRELAACRPKQQQQAQQPTPDAVSQQGQGQERARPAAAARWRLRALRAGAEDAAPDAAAGVSGASSLRQQGQSRFPPRRALHGTSIGVRLGRRHRHQRFHLREQRYDSSMSSVLQEEGPGAADLGVEQHLIGAYARAIWDCLPGDQRAGLPLPEEGGDGGEGNRPVPQGTLQA